VLQVSPLLSRKEASAEAVNAVAYATKYHSGPFWSAARKEVENGALGRVLKFSATGPRPTSTSAKTEVPR